MTNGFSPKRQRRLPLISGTMGPIGCVTRKYGDDCFLPPRAKYNEITHTNSPDQAVVKVRALLGWHCIMTCYIYNLPWCKFKMKRAMTSLTQRVGLGIHGTTVQSSFNSNTFDIGPPILFIKPQCVKQISERGVVKKDLKSHSPSQLPSSAFP